MNGQGGVSDGTRVHILPAMARLSNSIK